MNLLAMIQTLGIFALTMAGATARPKPDLRIERVRLDVLTLDPNNARKHGKRNLDAIMASLDRFGQRRPLVVSHAGTVIAGNGTLEAARALGWDRIAITRTPEDWTDDEAKAYALTDNRTAELATWDEDLLGVQLVELEAAGWDTAAFGFEPASGKVIEREEEIDLEVPADPISSLGDLWVLGKHRVLCGDSTVPETYKQLMGGEQARMMFTDPPWNVAIGQDSNPKHRQRAGLKNDDLSSDDFARFLESFAQAATPHVAGDVYCVLGASEWPMLDMTLRRAGFHWSATVIWVKDVFVLGRSKYHRRYEPIWYGWRNDSKSSFQGRRDLDDVWEIPRPRRSDEHPTMKPVALVQRAIEASSKVGEIVLEPFAGSGSSIIAAEQANRSCYAVELEPGYVDVVCRRFQQATGIVPVNEATGQEQDFAVSHG